MEESELDIADTFPSSAGWEQDTALPVLPSSASSQPRPIPGKRSGSDNPSFTSAGRHILYCGTDLLVDNAQFHTSPRKHNHHSCMSRSADAQGNSSYMLGRRDSGHIGGAAGTVRATGDSGDGTGQGLLDDGPELKRLRSDPHEHGRQQGPEGDNGGGSGGGDEAGGDDDDEIEDDVLEVETDTPGGYHVSAVLTHHRDANDPEEYIVEARVHP